MALRFILGAQLFANKSQVVVGVGIAWIEPHCMAKVQPRRFQSADFLKDATEIEVRQSIFGIYLESASKVFGRFFKIPFLIAERSAI